MNLFRPRHSNSSATDSSSSANSPFIGVQAKLNIGKSNDKYEKEADAVADKVVNREGLFGNQPFIAPSPNIQKMDEGENELQKSEETEQVQEKSIHETITPLVQRMEGDEADVQRQEKEAVQAREEEEPVQMMEEVDVQRQDLGAGSDLAEESIQKAEEEDPTQTKSEEDTDVQQRLDTSTDKSESDIQKKPTESIAATETPTVQRKDEEIQEKDEEIQEKEADVQRKEMGTGSDPEDDKVQGSNSKHTGDTSNLESNLSSSKGGGSPMDSSTKDQMESGFGTDFSGVRIHNDSNAVQMNQELGSQAFANGNDIYFNEGKYDPGSKDGQHLLAHELTHTVQQGASNQPAAQTSIQKAAAAPEPADAPATKPTTPLDISHKLNLTDAWSKYLDEQYASGKRKFEVDVKIGTRYSGTIELSKKSGTAKGELAKYEITRGTKKNFLNVSGWSFLQPLRAAGVDPVLVLEKFGDEQVTTGFLSVAVKGIAVGNAKGFIDSLNDNLDKMGFLGLEPIKITDGFENKFEQGRLIFKVGAMTTVVDGYLEAGGGLGITGDTFTFNVNAKVDVAGLASGELMLARGESGKLSGKLDIEADIANVNAKIMVEYIEGAVTIQGTGKIQSEKFSGEITLLVTDKAKSKQMMNAALGVESMDAEKSQAEVPAADPIPKSKNNQVLAGWGEVTANITPWLAGVAKVGIDSEGHVTIVGEITVPDDIELMEQRGKKVDLFKVEIRAGYGIPLVGQVFLFASIGMFMNAGFGPLVLKNVGFKGTYSTDPDILQEFEITGTLNINAFAIIGLEAEAGVGVTILGHDLKAGVNVTAAAGLRAYAEATPTLEYKEQKSPAGGKVGETRLKGHFEAAAQLFMQLSGSLFYELDSPWWSPAPDGREDFPLGEVQYPIGDSMGIGADMDWLVGSPDIPELKFSPVEFDPDKFTADVMADPPPGKKGKSDENKAGKWEDKNKPSEGKDTPETKDGKGLKGSDKKKEDLKKLPDQQKYMRSLDEMSKLEKASPKPTLAVVQAKAKKVKSKYGIDSITVKDKKDQAEISVKHKKENNKKNILKVPLMSAAERYKLLKTSMDDLKARNKKAGGEAGTVSEEDAKTLITAWKKAHPVVEVANVVDGGKTWDYFIDIGDKQNTEKGKRKSETVKADEKDLKSGDGEVGKIEHFTVDGHKHKLWIKVKGNEVEVMLASDPSPLEKTLLDWKNEIPSKNWQKKTKESQTKEISATLKMYYDAFKLAKEVNKLNSQSKDAATAESNAQLIAKDDELEALEGKIKLKLTQLFARFAPGKKAEGEFPVRLAAQGHYSAKGILETEGDKVVKDKQMTDFQVFITEVKKSAKIQEVQNNPITNDTSFGKYVKNAQVEKAAKEALKDKTTEEANTIKDKKIEGIEGTKFKSVKNAINSQLFDRKLEPKAYDGILEAFGKSGSSTKTAEDIFKGVKEAVKAEINKTKYPLPHPNASAPAPKDWLAVFASKGKQLFKPGMAAGKDEPQTLMDLLKDEAKVDAQLRGAIHLAIEETINADPAYNESPEIIAEVKRISKDIMNHFKDKKVFFIRGTSIVRNLAGGRSSDLFRANTAHSDSLASMYQRISDDYSKDHADQIKSMLSGQVHHLVPLYLGGSHKIGNLIKAVGDAKVGNAEKEGLSQVQIDAIKAKAAKSAHFHLHQLIDTVTEVTTAIKDDVESAVPAKTIKLASLTDSDINKAISSDKLSLVIGTVFEDGNVAYEQTNIKIDDLQKDPDT